MSLDEMEEARNAFLSNYSEVADIIKDINVILNWVADKAPRLIYNLTTNLAENWMNIRTKFTGGKRVDRYFYFYHLGKRTWPDAGGA